MTISISDFFHLQPKEKKYGTRHLRNPVSLKRSGFFVGLKSELFHHESFM
ncbi:conserved hypothetical protein [delta proteobacterium NaphS2]|nr:conserved hypothetical protein [delta proteobacterium NaphS2]